MKTEIVARSPLLEAEFFERADTLWEQFERTLSAKDEIGGLLRQVSSPGTYTFLLATADQVFTRDLVLAFLNRLRAWGKEKLGARHASTPQIHVYASGCRRELVPDATRARWHYLYSLTRSEPPAVRFLGEDEKTRFGIALGRISCLQLPFNQLVAHETHLAYALNGPKREKKPLEGTILLHGYLW